MQAILLNVNNTRVMQAILLKVNNTGDMQTKLLACIHFYTCEFYQLKSSVVGNNNLLIFVCAINFSFRPC